MTLDEIHNRIFGEQKPLPTILTCPITGKLLWSLPVEHHVMDASHYYFPEGDRKIIFERHPFSWSLFRHTNSTSLGGKVISWWRLNDDNSWTSMIEIKGLDGVYERDIPYETIKKLLAEHRKEKKKRHKEYQERLKSGLPVLPNAIKINASCLGTDLVVVEPMGLPTGNLMYFDIVVNKENDTVKYPYTVTSMNVDDVNDAWDLHKYSMYETYGDIKIGDTITEWDNGGALSLSLRRGEYVVRDGIEIYKRLTAMS